jgi:ADP-heptose:LPS heptosyltransferase
MSEGPLLVVHPGALGDVVALFALLESLRNRFRPLDVLCQGRLGRLCAALQLADGWLPLEAAWTASLFADVPSAAARQRLSGYRQVILFSFAPRMEASFRHLGFQSLCVVPPRPPAGVRLHVAAHAFQHLVRCGLLSAEDGPRDRPRKPLPAAEGKAPPVLLHPGSGSPRKRWPLSGFLTVADRLAAWGMRAEFVTGPAEGDLAARLRTGGHALHELQEPVALLERLASAGAWIGNDSGASHLAAWAGLPSVVIFGPSDPVRWRPMGEAVEIVRPVLECTPCFETEPANCASGDCLVRITTADVMAAFRRVAGLT